jgi:hypothetical protein
VKEWFNNVLASGVVAAVVSSVIGAVSGWFSAAHQAETQLQFRQAEAGYQALVKANKLKFRADELQALPDQKDEVAKLRKDSDDEYILARHNIAAFGDERIVKALSDYWVKYGGAAKPCVPREKAALDTKIYTAIRNSMGVGGNVSDNQIANVVFLCSLK